MTSHTTPNIYDWKKRFSNEFTDDILPDGYGNDLLTSKEDVEPLMNFIAQELNHVRQETLEQEREKLKILVKDICFGAVIDCEPDCDPVTHARHDGSWKTHWKIEQDLLEALSEQEKE